MDVGRDGAQGRDRTTDTVIFSHVLYQLSYLGILRPVRVTKGARRGYRGSILGCPEWRKTAIPAVWAGTGKAALALVCVVDGAAFPLFMGIFAPAPVRDAMSQDLERLFPMQDLPSARLMKLKAFCLYRAGLLSEAERAAVIRKAKAFIQNPRFRSALHPRRAA